MITRNELFALLAIAKYKADKGTGPHGLAIERTLAKAGHVTNQGALYGVLVQLKGAGLIRIRTGRRTQSGGKAPLYYAMTDEGHAAVLRFFATLDLLRHGELKGWTAGLTTTTVAVGRVPETKSDSNSPVM